MENQYKHQVPISNLFIRFTWYSIETNNSIAYLATPQVGQKAQQQENSL